MITVNRQREIYTIMHSCREESKISYLTKEEKKPEPRGQTRFRHISVNAYYTLERRKSEEVEKISVELILPGVSFEFTGTESKGIGL